MNELRLAIGSFAPCQVVMEGCTRVLPLVALQADSVGSTAWSKDKGDTPAVAYEDSRKRAGVSPNRHPEARTGAANLKVT